MSGSLSRDKSWRVDRSRSSSLPAGKGDHFIVTIEGDERSQDEIEMVERQELIGVAYRVAFALCAPISPGRFRIEINGPSAASRPHLHVHIICPPTDFKIRRSVDPIAAAPTPAA